MPLEGQLGSEVGTLSIVRQLITQRKWIWPILVSIRPIWRPQRKLKFDRFSFPESSEDQEMKARLAHMEAVAAAAINAASG